MKGCSAHSRRVRPDDGGAGFTLVELMVSLFIFALLSAAGVALLAFSVRAQGAAGDALRDVGALRRVNALLGADLAQAVPRPYRDSAGALRPAFTGNGDTGGVSLGLVRGGWSNPDGLPRASLQRVEYRLAADRLERVAWPHVDGAAPMPPAVLLTGVSGLRLRFRTGGAWTDRWDSPRAEALPQAVEIVADVNGLESVRQLFLVGVGAGVAPPPPAGAVPPAGPVVP